MDRKYETRHFTAVCALLGLLILVVFWPVSRFDFQAYDDQRYVAANPAVRSGLTRQGLAWALGYHISNWHPLTWISHMVDVQLFGMNSGAHHLTNVFWHIANSVLLLLVLKRMTGALWRSAFVAALFAFHPMHVESVAWIAERKDVLSTFFFMMTLWAYTGYVQSQAQSPKSKADAPSREHESQRTSGKSDRRKRLNYWAAILFFSLGLLSKPMLVTLPFVLLLLDYWPLQRLKIKNQLPPKEESLPLLYEKVPFFLLAVASSVLTFLAQRSGGSVASLQLFSFESRIANALAAYAGYLEKLIWPTKLAVLYLPPASWPIWYLAVAFLILAAITVLAVWQIRLRPYFIVGWLWFLGTLIPVIGLVQVGSQYMADRYSYVPFIGCFICIAWGGWDLVKGWQELKSCPSPSPSPSGLAALTLWRSGRGEGESCTVEKTGGESAITNSRAWQRGPVWGVCLLVLAATALTARHQLGFWQTPESLFRHCVQVTSDNYVAYNNLGASLVNQHRYDEAKTFYQESIRINPAFPDVMANMGTLLALQGDITNAMSYLQRAVELNPESAESYGKLGVALSEQGRAQDAIACYRESLRLRPDQVPACNNLAWILATNPNSGLRNGVEAVGLAQHACQLTGYKQPLLVGTLAAAFAEAGRFSEAIGTADKAIELATSVGQKELAQKNRELRNLYQSGQAYHETPTQ
jgi:tetratricopeptide (TPR) repeat protein